MTEAAALACSARYIQESFIVGLYKVEGIGTSMAACALRRGRLVAQEGAGIG